MNKKTQRIENMVKKLIDFGYEITHHQSEDDDYRIILKSPTGDAWFNTTYYFSFMYWTDEDTNRKKSIISVTTREPFQNSEYRTLTYTEAEILIDIALMTHYKKPIRAWA